MVSLSWQVPTEFIRNIRQKIRDGKIYFFMDQSLKISLRCDENMELQMNYHKIFRKTAINCNNENNRISYFETLKRNGTPKIVKVELQRIEFAVRFIRQLLLNHNLDYSKIIKSNTEMINHFSTFFFIGINKCPLHEICNPDL